MATKVYCSSWGEHGGDNGLWAHDYDAETGALGEGVQIDDTLSSSNCFVDEENRLLYFVDEVDQPFDEKAGIGSGGGGNIWVYRVGAKGDLKLLQKRKSFGSNPSMFTKSPDGNWGCCSIHGANPMCCQVAKENGVWTIVPRYAEGSVVLFEMNSDGTIGEVVDIFKNEKATVPPHMHSCVWDPKGRFIVVNDKGTGLIYTLKVDEQKKRFVELDRYDAGADSKPRYVRFHPTKKFFFVNYEAANRLDAFSYTSSGKMALVGSDLVVPQEQRDSVDQDSRFESQDLRIDAKGRFLYSCYRGSNDHFVGKKRIHDGGFQGVAVYQVDQKSGEVTTIQRLEFDDIYWERGCAISPDGKFLLVGSLYSDKVATCAIGSDGRLADTGRRADQDTCSGITFFEL